MKDKKLAIFDLDGTLIDAYKAITETVNYCLKELGYSSVSFETVKRSVGRGDIDLAKKLVGKEDVSVFTSLYRKNHLRFFNNGNVKLLEGAEELLKYLKDKGLYIAVATNRAGFSVSPILKRLNIDNYFDIIYTSDDVKSPKPDPEMLFNIMEYFKTEKGQTFFVGDMDIDYLAGKNAGVDTYIVLTGSSLKDDFSHYPDVNLFDNLILLKNYLDNLRGGNDGDSRSICETDS
ncbi:MAG: HAD family hydrolase [Candidatus Ratteibacteria bacterium]|nr:HAD family hydrolase [Candidatus Ratteibacteria bacterium]